MKLLKNKRGDAFVKKGRNSPRFLSRENKSRGLITPEQLLVKLFP